MQNLIVKSHKVTLNNNLMTGDTFPIKSWIKTYLCGKWDANRGGWIVDTKQVEQWMSHPSIISIDDSAPLVAAHTTNHNGICPRCHTYCDGDCTSH